MKVKAKKIGIAMMIIGALVIFTRFIGVFTFKEEGKAEASEFIKNNLNSEQISENPYKDIKIGEKLGVIEIPDISVKHIIVEGTGNEEIRKNIGHFEYTAFPGEYGNFAIAGHDTNLYNEVFKDLKDLDIGAEIIIKAYNGEFKYRIAEKIVVDSTDFSVINQDVSKQQMTMITCTQKGQKRLAIKADLIK